MTTVRKSSVLPYLKELDERYQKLKKELTGNEPNTNVYDQYHNNVDQFKEEFCEFDKFKVALAVEDFQTILKQLKSIEKLKAPRLRR